MPNLLIHPSADVGLHPHLLSYDASVSNGINAGWNPITTVKPVDLAAAVVTGITYRWYVGNIRWDKAGKAIGQPVEFGAVNLVAADPLLQHTHSLVAALIVEPEGTDWRYDRDSAGNVITRTCANVVDMAGRTLFRDMVLLTQDDLALGTTANGFNFGTEPFGFRGVPKSDTTRAVSDQQVMADPQTPVFAVARRPRSGWQGSLHPGGKGNAEVFTIDGHVWQEEPYQAGSMKIGPNLFSQWMGSRASLMPNDAYNIVLERAGGRAGASGDFLYRVFDTTSYTGGWWGLMRVTDPGKDGIVITNARLDGVGHLVVDGWTVVDASKSTLAPGVQISPVDANGPAPVQGQVMASVVRAGGKWEFTSTPVFDLNHLAGKQIRATSSGGGVYTVPIWATTQLFPTVARPLSQKHELLAPEAPLTPAEIKAENRFRK